MKVSIVLCVSGVCKMCINENYMEITRNHTITEEFLILYKQDSYNPKRLTVKLVQSSSTYNYNDAVDGRVDSSPEGGSTYLDVPL